MPKVQMKCRVCGKSYEACRSLDRSTGVFRWQSVACSPECGAEYLRLIEESRGISHQRAAEPAVELKVEPAAEPVEIAEPVQKRGKSKASAAKADAPKETPESHEDEDGDTSEK